MESSMSSVLQVMAGVNLAALRGVVFDRLVRHAFVKARSAFH